jgi:hypothetical protein
MIFMIFIKVNKRSTGDFTDLGSEIITKIVAVVVVVMIMKAHSTRLVNRAPPNNIFVEVCKP